MDEMSITSKFMTTIISKILTKAIKKNVGANVHVKNIHMINNEGTIKCHIELDGDITEQNLAKLINKYI